MPSRSSNAKKDLFGSEKNHPLSELSEGLVALVGLFLVITCVVHLVIHGAVPLVAGGVLDFFGKIHQKAIGKHRNTSHPEKNMFIGACTHSASTAATVVTSSVSTREASDLVGSVPGGSNGIFGFLKKVLASGLFYPSDPSENKSIISKFPS